MFTGTWDFVSGHPDLIISLKFLSVLSFAVASLSSSSFDLVAGRFEVTMCTCKSTSFSIPYSAIPVC